MLIYKIGKFDDVDDFLRNVGKVRGVLKRGGVPDVLAAARVVLNDWNGGRIPYYTTPPTRGDAMDRKHAVSEVVNDWGKEFDAEKVFKDEENAVIAGLPELDDADVDFVQSNSAGVARLDAAGEEAESDSEDEMEEDVEEEDEEDEEDEMDETASGAVEVALERAAGRARKEGTGADEKKAQYARSKVLYGADGQLNPNQNRAAKKKAKKIKAAVAKSGGGDESGSDFEWEEQE
jgi:nuclear GTP-binding protein